MRPFARSRDPLQPGCFTIFCAHSRAYEYFAETVYPGQERHFEATRCNKLGAYKRGRCVGPTVPMGMLAGTGATAASGSYFLLTNAASPFGRGAKAPPSGDTVTCDRPADERIVW